MSTNEYVNFKPFETGKIPCFSSKNGLFRLLNRKGIRKGKTIHDANPAFSEQNTTPLRH